ncbi:hypothetical protein HanRHA438_Chr15g0697191 [Helianthus annuus]|uniref:Uncharacterized protein n=1 Tax=Helianthus annuus TaxID=4232 RepID=A0A9K3DZF4_HELAN|nr:hypothetical protein HanXRQr2_Chr15g0685191 [Helianthus annuus]KAJ0472462.1 hypothetical protein HanHA89_Chr15g0607311 [Helianthus annuus]KAJ0648063.1 hypothetical protein HanLR1_Chr15g0568671 [Helianthus annuus]KAJ0678350.1 hypothetical protein HanOQP8_Chr12g0446971 [Helianthus annuus]KAJ0843968.1 hypothetical protein HanRHA438_Chr15g0697191 [Helianthus annuus]
MRDEDEVITLWSYFRQRLAGGDIFFRPLRVERRCLFRARVYIG